MSGPIVRKYGFPNFDQIFGKKELQHGVDGDDASNPDAGAEPETAPAPPVKEKPKSESAKKSS